MLRSRIESIGVSLPRNGPWKPGSLAHATKAGSQCLGSSCYLPIDVEVLINAGVHRDRHYAEPAFASYIQNKLAINIEFQRRQTASFDLQNGGCGMLSALHVLTTMMQSGAIRTGMAIASEVNTDRDPDPDSSIIASGAAIILDISPSADRGFGSFVFRTYDEHIDLSRSMVDLGVERGRLLMHREKDLDQTCLSLLPEVWEELLESEQVKREDIDLLIPSQISARFLAGLPATLGLPPEKIVDVFPQYGDTLTTSPVLALDHAQKQGRVEPGTRIAFLTVGSGITVGAAIYDF
ncbi:3-oxoacyl-ACP synthase III family protein [Gemmatimonadota bacterium]